MKQRPARILFLNSRSEYGGTDMALLSIVRTLNRERFQAIVVLPHVGPLVADFEAAGAEIIYLDICRLERLASPGDVWLFVRRFAQSLSRLRRIIRERDIALVYTNSAAIQVGALAARLAGIPNLWHIPEIWTNPRWLTIPLYRYIYAFADRILPITHAVAEGNFGKRRGKITILRDGIDLSRFEGLAPRSEALQEQFELETPWPIVTTVARMVPQKGLGSFVEAAGYVRDAGVDACFCIAGDIPRPIYQAYKDHLKDLVTHYHLKDRVRFLGWIDDVPALLHASDLFVLASIGPEGAGLVIPEAWLSGVPAIGPNHTGPKEIIQHGRNGLLFEAGNAEDLAEKTLIMLNDAGARQEMAENGRQDALVHNDARRNTALLEDIMTDLIQR